MEAPESGDRLLVEEILCTGRLPDVLPRLPRHIQGEIRETFKRLQPLCPSCLKPDHVQFRYFNNKEKSRTLQARYICKNVACSPQRANDQNASKTSAIGGSAKKRAYHFTYKGYQSIKQKKPPSKCKANYNKTKRKVGIHVDQLNTSTNKTIFVCTTANDQQGMLDQPSSTTTTDLMLTFDEDLSRHYYQPLHPFVLDGEDKAPNTKHEIGCVEHVSGSNWNVLPPPVEEEDYVSSLHMSSFTNKDNPFGNLEWDVNLASETTHFLPFPELDLTHLNLLIQEDDILNFYQSIY